MSQKVDDLYQADLHEAIQTLLAGESQLSAKDKSILASLAYKRYQYGSWTPSQFEYAQSLFKRGIGQDDRKKVSLGSFEGVYKLFEKAAQHLKYPKVRLSIGGEPVQLYRAGSRSKYPGEIMVTDGKPFGQNKYYGRVDKGGNFMAGRESDPAVLDLLKDFGENPDAVASQYGRLHGRCCFCQLPLSDERSTAVGYGPVCAKHYGLEEQWKQAVGVLDVKEAA